ncbi:MAG TPA: Gfo/Idh/MocA family oxidoreductase [Candidatus Acidoferrales bacterium]|nr:Gfo/Idh/MocA family oxidoreductase [Candidatus Acidoferrales bacterium]
MAPGGIAHHDIRRREFLQAAGSAALASPPCGRGVRGANDRVNLAFIGLGRRGSANLWHAARVPGFRIAAVCDLHAPALQQAQAQAKALGFTGTKAHRDFGEILADGSIDAVCIAVPGALTPHLTVQACQSGKDVYVETPVFVNLDEGPPMVDAARQCRRVVQAGTALRSGVAFRKAREVIQSGQLGGVAFCRLTGATEPMPVIDLLQFLFDEAAPVSVAAQVGVGLVDITFRYPAFIASYQSLAGPAAAKRAAAQPVAAKPPAAQPWNVSIHGSRATLALSRAGYSLVPGVFPAGHGHLEVSSRRAVEPRGDPVQVAHWKNFLECIRTGRRPAGDIEACVRSTTACLRAGLAMRPTWMSV